MPDGYAEVIAGADFYSNGQTNEGVAFVHGSASGLKKEADWMGEINEDNSSFGSAVAGAGDIDKNGFADVVIGAPYYIQSGIQSGAAFVYHEKLPGDPSFHPQPLAKRDPDLSGLKFANW